MDLFTTLGRTQHGTRRRTHSYASFIRLGIDIELGNDPDHRRGLQDLAPGVHHQLLLDSRGEAHCILERGGARLGDLYEFGGSKAVVLDTMSALAELVCFSGDVQRKSR